MNAFEKLQKNLNFLINRFKKALFFVFLAIVFMGVGWAVSLAAEPIFYYQDKHNKKLVHERRKIIPLQFESPLQALVRLYISGGVNYDAKIPFSRESRILGVYHDREMKNLVLNWNSFFARDLQNEDIDTDMLLLFRTLKENTNVEIVYFLVEGRSIELYWNDILLDKGVNLENKF